jgi:hypothetical protein
METQTKTGAKDFFINLGAIIALGTIVGNLVSLLFTIINKAYPVTTGYSYYGTYSISFPVASLIVFFPIYILLMWLLEKGYAVEPEKRNIGVRKWLTYITLFLTGLAFAIDLIYVIYYFIDGQEMTTGFILKALSVLVISLAVFFYYISDVRGKLNSTSRKVWTFVTLVIILGAIAWGFSVLGSPRTQQLIKYDEQKVGDLTNMNSAVQNYYQSKGMLPNTLAEISGSNYYHFVLNDAQTGRPYEYQKTSETTYNVCAIFNKQSEPDSGKNYGYSYPYGSGSWTHTAGHYCFSQTINSNLYPYSKSAIPVPAQ